MNAPGSKNTKPTGLCRDGKPHWWVRSGLGLRCKLCGRRKRAKLCSRAYRLAFLLLSVLAVGCDPQAVPEASEPATPRPPSYQVWIGFAGSAPPSSYYGCSYPEEIRPGVWQFTNASGKSVLVANPQPLMVVEQ
jgi:hypothetical protein